MSELFAHLKAAREAERDRPVREWARGLGISENTWYALSSGRRRLTATLLRRMMVARPDLRAVMLKRLSEQDPVLAEVMAAGLPNDGQHTA